jgi:adenylate cyclase
MIMATYFITRMGYYAMGLISPDAMEGYINALSFEWFFTPVFLSVVLVHMSLGLWKLYRRNTLKMPLWEIAQVTLGLLLPFFLFPYLITTFLMGFVFNLKQSYVDNILLTYPAVAWSYVSVALIMGAHGQIGAHAVLRMRPWYPRVRWIIAAFLTVIPIAAALGYLNGGSTLYHELIQGQLAADDLPHPVSPDQQEFIRLGHEIVYIALAAIYAFLFTARGLRLRAAARNKTIVVSYPGDAQVKVIPGTTILEASRIGEIAHASICGGRGRCTTCRVKILDGMENLSPVGEREHKALLRIRAGADVRLACQAQCQTKVISVLPLLAPEIKSTKARKETTFSVGRDMELSVMFADLRGFTSISEGKFPYDVVYILNSYFEQMGKAIERHEGKIDKFLGDGILAYFGKEGEGSKGALNAILSTLDMAKQLAEVNTRLASVLEVPLTMGVGLHFGEVILGEIGYKENSNLTIIGDTVNTASRLQTLTKEAGAQLILSTALAAKAGLDLSHLPLARAKVRGKTEPMRVYIVKDILKDLETVARQIEATQPA